MVGTSTLRIAWRNLWRNRRRTTLALAAIGLAQALVLVYGGVFQGYGDWMLESITGPMIGHAQAHAPEWRRDRAMDRTLAHVSAALAELRRDPDVAAAHARIYAPVLAAAGEQGYAAMVLGVDAASEAGPAGLLRGVAEPLDGRRVLIGRSLAEMLGTRAGDTLAVVGQGADGSLANELVVVAGLVQTPVDLVNRMGIVMALPQAQELFMMPDRAHEILIRARAPERAPAVVERARGLAGLAGAEVLDWKTIAPQLVELVDLVGAAWYFILILVFVAAAAGVANTMLMATYERTHELGMLLALGTRPGRIVGMIVAESLALGVVGVLLGTALGIATVAIAHRTGVDLSALAKGAPEELSFAGLSVSMRIHPTLNVGHVVQGIVAVVLTSLVASAWPALRAGRLQPMEAMRE